LERGGGGGGRRHRRRRKTIYSILMITSGRCGRRDRIRLLQLPKTAPIGTIAHHFGNISSWTAKTTMTNFFGRISSVITVRL